MPAHWCVRILLDKFYNLMQQGIALETKRNSSAMKSIAMLTMVFLPATAVALRAHTVTNSKAEIS